MPTNDRRQRAKALREVGGLYKRLTGCDLDVCFYCKHARETLDHVPPVSVVINLDLNEYRKKGGMFFLVPCCSDCNRLLGSKALATISERLVYLHGKYSKLVEKFYFGWTADEIQEIGPGLRDFIAAKRTLGERYIVKLRKVEDAILAFDDQQDQQNA